MRKLKITDVTLRDGGYKNNFTYTPQSLSHIITELDKSGIDYIEVGYRNGPFKSMPNIGPTGICDKSYLQYCRQLIRRAQLTVILHPKNLQQDDFKEMHNIGVDCVRICFPNHNTILGLQAIEWALQSHLKVFVNFTRITHTPLSKLIQLVANLANYELQAINLADSNGSLMPSYAKVMFAELAKVSHVPLGFHAHDNLFLAQTNAVVAMQQGFLFLDSSLYGYGKGTGNLKTEAIVSYLHASGINNYDVCRLLEAANYVKHLVNEEQLSIKDILMGIFDLSQDDAMHLLNAKDTYDLYEKAKNYNQQKIAMIG